MDDNARMAKRGFVLLAVFSVLALLVTGAWLASSEYTRSRIEARQNAQQYAASTADRIQRSCRGTQGRALTECIVEQIAASREDQRSQYDLNAQQQMTYWSTVMAAASLLTALIAAWALWYVKGTLDATQRAVADTSKATQAMERQNVLTETAQRPWIDIDLIVTKIENAEKFVRFDYTMVLKNIGSSVAESVWLHFHPLHEGEGLGKKIQMWRDIWWNEAKGPSPFALMPNESYSIPADSSISKRDLAWRGDPETALGRHVTMGVAVSAFYKVPGQSPLVDRRRTDRFFRIGLAHEDPFFQLVVFEKDIRTVEADDVRGYKTRNTVTT